MNTLTQKAKDLGIESIYVGARRWRQKTYGNTYHSVEVSALCVDGRRLHVGRVPFKYGGEHHYLVTAGRLLVEEGLINIENGYALHSYDVQESLKIVHMVQDVPRKKDL